MPIDPQQLIWGLNAIVIGIGVRAVYSVRTRAETLHAETLRKIESVHMDLREINGRLGKVETQVRAGEITIGERVRENLSAHEEMRTDIKRLFRGESG